MNTERQAEIARLREEHRDALATPLASEGGVSPYQIHRMSKAQRGKWDRLRMERMDVEAKIRELQRSDEEIERERQRAEKRAAESRANQLRSQIEFWNRRGIGVSLKTGKLKPTFRKMIAEAQCELDALLARDSL
jgi:hypothetical protein